MTDEVFIIAAYGMLVILSILAIVTIGTIGWIVVAYITDRHQMFWSINPGAIRNITLW
jgi:hypothetical protein